VISGRNEAGKSTLVEALRAALFERHDAGNRKIRALQTYGTRNAPRSGSSSTSGESASASISDS
jgi:predicted ATPase